MIFLLVTIFYWTQHQINFVQQHHNEIVNRTVIDRTVIDRSTAATLSIGTINATTIRVGAKETPTVIEGDLLVKGRIIQ